MNVQRMRMALFPDRLNGALSVLMLAACALLLWQLVDWGLLRAVFRPDLAACSIEGSGACWGVIVEKWRVLIFGRFPYEAQWRPALALLLLLSALVASLRARSRMLMRVVIWLIALPAFMVLMGGGVFGLSAVPSRLWGGLPLTCLLWLLGMAIALPCGLLAALGRESRLPVLRTAAGLYVELVRGVPLVSILFMASFMLPLLLPPDARIDMLVRVQIALGLFAGAYLAENIRGGIQAVAAGQFIAAASLGFTRAQAWRYIVLPQALRLALPAMFNSFIGLFKETALVTVVSLYELTGSLSLALGGDPVWRPFFFEAYLFVGFIYWLCCFALSRYSQSLERRLSRIA